MGRLSHWNTTETSSPLARVYPWTFASSDCSRCQKQVLVCVADACLLATKSAGDVSEDEKQKMV